MNKLSLRMRTAEAPELFADGLVRIRLQRYGPDQKKNEDFGQFCP